MTKCNKGINHLYLLLTSAPISRKVKQSDEKVNNDTHTHTKAERRISTVLKFIHLHSVIRIPVSSQPISIHTLLLLNEKERKNNIMCIWKIGSMHIVLFQFLAQQQTAQWERENEKEGECKKSYFQIRWHCSCTAHPISFPFGPTVRRRLTGASKKHTVHILSCSFVKLCVNVIVFTIQRKSPDEYNR